MEEQAVLLERARAGDKDAFVRLVQPFERAVRSVVRGMLRHRPEDVDDVVQEALLRAYRGVSRFRGEASVRTWFHRIAVNATLDALRRRRLLEVLDDEALPELPAPGADPFEVASIRHDVAAAIAALPPTQQAIVLLVDIEDLDYGTVGQMLGIPRGTVASRLHRAHGTLRSAFCETELEAA